MAEKKAKDPVANAGMWGAIAGAASNIVSSGVSAAGMFTPAIRENNLAIAEANARAAEAGSGASEKMFGIDRKYVLIGGGVLGIIIIAMVFMNKSN